MPQLCIPTPPLDDIRTVDLEVTIDGRPQRVQYRVERMEWPADTPDRAAALRDFVAQRGANWLLVQIGPPTEQFVPVLFRLRASEAPQTTP